MKCPNCGAAFDLKQQGDVLRCTYCGATAQRPGTPASGGADGDPLAPVMTLLEDRNQNGIPDAFEGIARGGVTMSHQAVVQTVSTTYSIDGKTYKSLDEMPPGIRRKFEQIRKSTGDAAAAIARAQSAPRSRVALVFETSGPGSSRTGMIVGLLVAILLLFMAIAVAQQCSSAGV